MGRECITMENIRNSYTSLVGEAEGKILLEDIGVDRMLTLM
jgi:hypothetical protein